MIQLKTRGKIAKPATLLLSASLIAPTLLAGCGGGNSDQSANVPPPPGAPRSAPVVQPKQGMSTKQKVALLAGAAALYYIYNKRKNKADSAKGPDGKYFISKSTGRVYYRNLKDGSFQWVSPPKSPISVPAEDAQSVQGYAGYNNQNTGRGFGGYGPDATKSYNDAEPAVWNQ